MKTKAWKDMTPNIIEGYRKLPIIVDIPQWWFAEITGGFGSHHY